MLEVVLHGVLWYSGEVSDVMVILLHLGTVTLHLLVVEELVGLVHKLRTETQRQSVALSSVDNVSVRDLYSLYKLLEERLTNHNPGCCYDDHLLELRLHYRELSTVDPR